MTQAAANVEAGYFVRFTPAQRVEHFITMVDFVGLVDCIQTNGVFDVLQGEHKLVEVLAAHAL